MKEDIELNNDINQYKSLENIEDYFKIQTNKKGINKYIILWAIILVLITIGITIFPLFFSEDDNQAPNSDDDLIILHVNDVHCGINDKIGYDGFVLYRDELKKKYKYVITVDVGDHIQGGSLASISEGSAIIEIMNKVGFDVAILGNHEFDYGIEQLTNLEKNLTSKYICANFVYRKDKNNIFEPYKIINAGNKKIAFLSVLTPLTFSKTYLSTIKDSEGNPLYDFLTGNNMQDLYDTIQNYINNIRAKKEADYIILLTHIGMKIEKYKSEELLSKLYGVDAVLDGHSHQIYNTTSPDKNKKDISISQTGTKLESIGKLILKKDGSIISEIISEVPEPRDKTNSIKINRGGKERWVDKNMVDFIDNLWDKYTSELNILFGFCNFDLIIIDEDTKSNYCRYKECTLGNLITDAIKNAGNGEISILNGGAIRNNMYKGNITSAQIMEILPWFNNIVQKRITGQCILDALEFGISQLPNMSGVFPQISGITFDVDISFDSTVKIDELGMFINVTGKRRVSNVKINGVDLELDKFYNASLIEYISNGGDGYSMFSKFDIYNESLITDTDSLIHFIQYNLNGEIPLQYKDIQGRINIINNNASYAIKD